MDELVNFYTLNDVNYKTDILCIKFTFTDEEEMISDLAAPMTEIEDDVETGVRLTRDIGIDIGEQLIHFYHRIKFVQSLKYCCILISGFYSIITGVQCDPDPLLQENMRLKLELRRMQGNKWSALKIKDDDAMTKFYTGLPSFAVFLWLFKYVFFNSYIFLVIGKNKNKKKS